LISPPPAKIKEAFYTGGELTYMQRTSYPLENNKLFSDPNHPSVISYKNFAQKNEDIFALTTLTQLEKHIPENPQWMHGARACSAIAQAICLTYGITVLIPSNTNLIDGVVQYEFLQS
jgi:hypothetical protein